MRSTAAVFSLILTLFVHLALAQSNELIVQGTTGKLYLNHTVTAGQTWYSIGRAYNIGPKALAAANNLSMDKPLIIGQQVQILLSPANFSQTTQKIAGETLLPVYHLVEEKEWMYRISVNHNKVPIGSLEKWNHITKDQVKTGMYLVVGFLKVKTSLSSLAKEPPPAPVSSATPGSAAATIPPPPPPPANSTNPTSRQTVPPPPPPSAGKPASAFSNTRSDTMPMMANKPTAAKKTDEKLFEPPHEPAPKLPAINFSGGFFLSDFSETGKTASGLAGTFKSTSGWQDGKYYALMNNVSVGTIVKIIYPPTHKIVYAKVLSSLPDMKESAGLAIRISNAAATELGMGEGKSNVDIRY